MTSESSGKMRIRRVQNDKQRYMPLLLLGDESEAQIHTYLDRGVLFVWEEEDGVRAVCLVTEKENGILEIKNLAVVPAWQRRGFGRRMIRFLCRRYRGQFSILQAGTGDSPATVPFYESLGFSRTHRIRNFFLTHYDHPIYEGGVQLTDMVYFQRDL